MTSSPPTTSTTLLIPVVGKKPVQENSMSGNIRLSLEREPNFFLAAVMLIVGFIRVLIKKRAYKYEEENDDF